MRWAQALTVAAGLASAGCGDARTHGGGPLSSRSEHAELAPPGELNEARFRHSATLLLDGTVLVLGGAVPGSDNAVGFQALGSAEVYSLGEDRFRLLDAKLATARAAHTATRLLDGSVLVTGGVDGEGMPVARAERYEPSSGSFTLTGELITPRALHSATLLGDGRVLIVGGSTTLAAGPALEQAEMYDPATERFESCAGSPHALPGANAAALLGDGRVFLLWPGSVRAELFDPETTTFASAAASLPSSFGRYTGMTRTDDGNLLIFTQDQAGPASVLFGIIVLDAEGRLVSAMSEPSWVPDDPDWEVSMARAHGVVCSDTQGLCVPSVGSPTSHEVVRQVEISGRQGHTASTLPDGSVLLAGGISSAADAIQVLASSERVDFGHWRSTPVASPIQVAHTATLLSDGRVLLTGGDDATLADRTALFDGRSLVPTGALLVPRSGHVCLPLLDGTALVAGGETKSATAHEEIFSWRTGKSQDAGFRLQSRGSAVALASGRFLFAGPESVEIYDGRVGSPPSLVALPAPLGCRRPPVSRLANGRVLILGEQLAVEVDPVNREVLSSTVLEGARCETQLAVLPDGTALLVQVAASGSYARLERYDPQQDEPAERVAVLSKSLPLPTGGRLFPWFERPAWLGSNSLSRYEPRRSLFEPQHLRYGQANAIGPVAVSEVVVLPDASLLALTGDVVTHWTTSWVKGGASPCCWDFPARPARVQMGTERTLRAAAGTALFPSSWPEGSSGTTNASPSNAPVPVWLPMTGGTAAVGTFVRWSTEDAVWRVPRTAFPGLGLLVLAVNGEHTALGPVEIAPSTLGEGCEQAGECASGRCVGGVCCNQSTCPTNEPVTNSGAGGQSEASCDDHECGDYRCSRTHDGCSTSCSSNLDCREGLVCSASRDGTCGQPLPAAELDSSCRMGPDVAGSRRLGTCLLLLAGVLARRRRRSRVATSRSERECAAARSAPARRPRR